MMRNNFTYAERLNFFLRRKPHRAIEISKLLYGSKTKNDIKRFRRWMKKGGKIDDRDKYVINGEECVDFYIRFENLHQDIKYLCEYLSIPFNPSNLPQKKTKIRPLGRPLTAYYDDTTQKIVQKLYDWEIKKFGYNLK